MINSYKHQPLVGKFRVLFSLIVVFSLVMGGTLVTTKTASAHAADSLIKTSDGTIWFITDNDGTIIRRPFTSDGAFRSYGFLSYDRVTVADGQDLAYTVGGFIPPRDGAIFCATQTKGSDVKGECSLITNGKKAAFVSQRVFQDLGFSFTRANYGDSSFLSRTDNVASSTEAHRSGVLVNDSGTIKMVYGQQLSGIPSQDVFNSWGWNYADVVPVNSADRALVQAGLVSARLPGQISLTDNSGVLYQYQKFLDLVDAYRTFPTNVVTSPADLQALQTLNNQMNSASTFQQLIPFFDAQSSQVFTEMPLLIDLFDDRDETLENLQESGGQFTIYGNSDFAIYTSYVLQTSSNYSYPVGAVFVKENGAWKVDYIGTSKWYSNYQKSVNPNNLAVTGSGNTDLKIVSANFSDPRISSQNNKLVIKVKNVGQTTVHKYYLSSLIESYPFITQDLDRSLSPGQEIVLSIPVNYFVYGDPVGMYNFQISVAAEGATDANRADNEAYPISQNFAY